MKRLPKLFKLVSSKAQKLFKKYLDPKPEKRPNGLAEVHRFMDDRWMSKVGIEKTSEMPGEEEGLCPSMYSFHSSPEEKNKLLFSLTQYGLETTVDRNAKKDRIRQWIQTSVIEEEDEENISDYDSEEDIRIKDNQTGPVGERIPDRGPITHNQMFAKSNGYLNNINDTQSTSKSSLKKFSSTTSLRNVTDYYTPPIDPRIPLEQQRSKLNAVLSASRLRLDTIENGNINKVVKNVRFEEISLNDNEKVNKIDNNNVINHHINVQIPQSEKFQNYSYNDKRTNNTLSPVFARKANMGSNYKDNQVGLGDTGQMNNLQTRQNGERYNVKEVQTNKYKEEKIFKNGNKFRDEKKLGNYSFFGSKSSSSNSNSTGKSTPR